ncbi:MULTISPECIES: cobalamin biosynthesis protein [Burkholderia]|uniref:Cobalamin biosynthesis protein CbiG n=1 Tax=Burkholderia savannae TaxID=1637837 RepID=A0ABR5TDM0_9BURK|nr:MULTISPECIES: cobalamin biosynthesis protein [Burkholderia]AOJ68883.1 cobalamin biosynthesis protein CbiG [Burkholderia savannae]AOJ80862.1 cobalamin biosynthesis protein CbiG [Burkholderia savannae]AOK47099.1 cobalamin biosynthesis protein CbiG [Burkholderia sp. MSMB617WGS]KGS08652.1 cobalamin synthesis G family protein [Burkholderia sp. ABCPW 111]KVG37959.1 cobalamin biosynthesis protein CbiG [Burkholderia sp. MSMB0265]
MMRVALGIGCRAGRPADAIEAAIRAALAQLPDASLADVGVVATLDAKAREPGLVECCARNGWPLAAFSRDEIAAQLARFARDARRAAGAAPSLAARARFGVDGVCEPCALLAAPNGALVVRKLALDGVTAALAGPL